MKRVYVYEDRTDQNGILVAVEDSFEILLSEIADRLQHEHIELFTENGCKIYDSKVLRDDDKVYLTREATRTLGSVNPQNEINNGCRTKNEVSDWITLNVGGKRFSTSRSTLLTKEPLSMLARMFADDNDGYLMNPSVTDGTGAFFIDRSAEYFEPILNYLRHGSVILDKHVNPKGVLEEAKFYGLDSMIPILLEMVDKYESHTSTFSDSKPLTRSEVVRAIITTPSISKLRFQGVNLAHADLNKLDLRHINFKYACLSHCNLSGANLSYCCLDRADLSHANLEGAQLLGVQALCANMEGANLKNCNMEDRAGCRTILEGVNLKGANLEGSNMAGVNLRVATLKHANLQNCDLRTAALAGADLECCDLSGSDLHEANLRGANLKDAAFELMLTPLHMSQTVR